MIKIYTFLFDGWCKPHSWQYVRRLAPHFIGYHFTVITNEPTVPPNIGCHVFQTELPPWRWNLKRMMAFGPNFDKSGNQIFIFDLDTVITKPIHHVLSYKGDFCTVRDFFHPNLAGGGIISFKAGRWVDELWRPLEANPRSIEQKTQGADRVWFRQQLQGQHDFWQDLFPDEFVSYKVHCKHGLPEKASIVSFHGKPRPHEVTDDWVKTYWKESR